MLYFGNFIRDVSVRAGLKFDPRIAALGHVAYTAIYLGMIRETSPPLFRQVIRLCPDWLPAELVDGLADVGEVVHAMKGDGGKPKAADA